MKKAPTYIERLKERIRNGELRKIDEFKGEFSFLSNFYYHKHNYTVEHGYQAAKGIDQLIVVPDGHGGEVTLYADKWILIAPSPGNAKRRGRKVKLPHDWKTRRNIVMWKEIDLKFNLPNMRELLLATLDIPLIEGNYWHDNYWGVCTCNMCRGRKGLNTLGVMLMTKRDKLKSEE